VPKWFLKELAIIDQTYRVEDTEDHDGYFIVKDVNLTLAADGGKSLFIGDPKTLHVHGPRVVLWIPEIAGQALEALRQMKLQALELKIYDNPVNELAYYASLQSKAKAKKAELAVDMISEGLMEADRLSRKKSFSYGGEKAEARGVPNAPKTTN
jgi:hypothetical protein